MYEPKVEGKGPSSFTHPQNRKIGAAGKFLIERYRLLRQRLEELLAVNHDEAISHSIEYYNEKRRLIGIYELAAKYPQVIDR